MCSNGRFFRELVRIHKQNPDTASGAHAGKGEFDVGDGDQVMLVRVRGDEIGKTKLRSLMTGLDAGSETGIFYEVKTRRAASAWRLWSART